MRIALFVLFALAFGHLSGVAQKRPTIDIAVPEYPKRLKKCRIFIDSVAVAASQSEIIGSTQLGINNRRVGVTLEGGVQLWTLFTLAKMRRPTTDMERVTMVIEEVFVEEHTVSTSERATARITASLHQRDPDDPRVSLRVATATAVRTRKGLDMSSNLPALLGEVLRETVLALEAQLAVDDLVTRAEGAQVVRGIRQRTPVEQRTDTAVYATVHDLLSDEPTRKRYTTEELGRNRRLVRVDFPSAGGPKTMPFAVRRGSELLVYGKSVQGGYGGARHYLRGEVTGRYVCLHTAHANNGAVVAGAVAGGLIGGTIAAAATSGQSNIVILDGHTGAMYTATPEVLEYLTTGRFDAEAGWSGKGKVSDAEVVAVIDKLNQGEG